MDAFALFAQSTTTTNAAAAGAGGLFVIALLALWILGIVAFWRVFTKAGRPGWASIIPIYNLYVMLKIAGRPGWWLLLYLIPIVDIIVHLIVAIDIAKAFRKSVAFGVIGLWFFSVIGFMILGLGEAEYKGASKR